MIAKATLNLQAQAIEDAQTNIRLIVKEAVMRNEAKETIGKRIKAEISATLKKLTLVPLAQAAAVSLWSFYLKQYATFKQAFNGDLELLALCVVLASEKPTAERRAAYEKAKYKIDIPQMVVNQYGVPNREYMQTYLRDRVKPVIDRLCKQYAIDPNDVDGRNSLRNRAEMEVRYQKHLDRIDGFKKRGVRLVICSTHADCSKRCEHWQGGVFSLNGTYGTTDDGRKFVPLEVATDQNQVYWTNPKTGTQYRGGLFGYNCRHYLVEYKSGFVFSQPDEEKERREYAITKEQRYYERKVREYKTTALYYKGYDRKKYEHARKLALEWNEKYISFSKSNGRAYYPSRTEIF